MRIAQFSYMASSSPIEAITGIIRGVSVIKQGLAEGHDLWIDGETISKLLALCKGPVKVKINHPEHGETAAFETTAGHLENFRVDGEHLRADLHLLRSGEYFGQIVEMSQKMPGEFGLSVRIGQDIEKKDGKEYCRPTSIESVDLVDAPAANFGLFSKKAHDPADGRYGGDHVDPDHWEKIKFEEDGKTHHKDCMCKHCKMSKKEKSMSAIFAGELADMQRKIDAATTTLAELQKKGDNAVALSKKAEIDNLMAEAAREGKVVPLDNEDLYTVSNGTVMIKTEPVQLSKMISKLPKGQISTPTKRASATMPTGGDGKPIEFDRRTPEGRAKQIAFSKQRQEEGAASLGRFIKGQAEPAIN